MSKLDESISNAVDILTNLPHIEGFPYKRNKDIMDALDVAVKCMTSPKIKSSAATDILVSKVLPKCRDTWEHDALINAIESIDYLEFLYNHILPNDMEQYMAMYRSRGVHTNGQTDNGNS